jgi:hypothetical protein
VSGIEFGQFCIVGASALGGGSEINGELGTALLNGSRNPTPGQQPSDSHADGETDAGSNEGEKLAVH